MLTFIILVLVSLMLITFLFIKRNKRMPKKQDKKQQDHQSRPHKPEIMAGELIVVGENEVHIELPKRPKEILAVFSRNCTITPCNPRHFDELKCYLCQFHNHYCLIIKWDVSNTRKIVWEAIF